MPRTAAAPARPAASAVTTRSADAPRFHVALPLPAGELLELPREPGHHALRVLRLGAGDALVLFDGGGREVPAVIESVQRDRVLVRLGEALSPLRESVLRIRLAQAISARERMDYTIVKAVELGVEALAPVAARRSVVRLDEDRAGKRLAHWQSLVVSACEQCGRNRLPSVEPVLPLAQWLASLPAGGEELRLLLHPGPGQRLRELHPAAAVTLLVGPEGGFAPDEVAAALAAGFLSVCLGPRILRTETAGPAAIAALQALWGDL